MKVYEQRLINRETAQLAQEWLEGTGYGTSRVYVSGHQVVLVIYGAGDRQALSELGTRLGVSLDKLVTMRLIVVPSRQEEYVAVRG